MRLTVDHVFADDVILHSASVCSSGLLMRFFQFIFSLAIKLLSNWHPLFCKLDAESHPLFV